MVGGVASLGMAFCGGGRVLPVGLLFGGCARAQFAHSEQSHAGSNFSARRRSLAPPGRPHSVQGKPCTPRVLKIPSFPVPFEQI